MSASSALTIRDASAADLDTIFAVQKAASTAAYGHIFPPEEYPFPDEPIRADLVDRFESVDCVYLVAEEEGRVVGLTAVSPGQVEQLYVLPEAQRRGVGAALLDAAVERRREAGDAELRLWTLEENANARRFYEGRGWRLAPETRVVPYPPHPVDVSYVRSL